MLTSVSVLSLLSTGALALVIQDADLMCTSTSMLALLTAGFALVIQGADLMCTSIISAVESSSWFMVQELAPHTSPIFVSAFRLLPAGLALVAWAAASGRQQPRGWQAWLACALFGLVDGTAFQVSHPALFL